MKKILTFVFVLSFCFNKNVLAHPMGVGDTRVDTNFKCVATEDAGYNKNFSFGFKKYKSKKDGSEILFSLNLVGEPANKPAKYIYPRSQVINFGPLTLEGEKYDNMYISFRHTGKKPPNAYLIKEALLKQGDQYFLNRVLMKSTKSLNSELENIVDDIVKEIDWSYEKTSDLLKEYYKKSSIYSQENLRDKWQDTWVYTCTIY